MDVDDSEARVAAIAAAIGEPARARMLFGVMDGRARTSTELALIGGVSPATASVHLSRLVSRGLLTRVAQGRHRYFRLTDRHVARALEGLGVLAGRDDGRPAPRTPHRLRFARTCYDHLAGAVAVHIHDRAIALGWLARIGRDDDYEVTTAGERAFAALGVDVAAARAARRRFAVPCLDWSERRPHLAGALGAALLAAAQKRRWISADLDTRAVRLTAAGRLAFSKHLGAAIPAGDKTGL